jgi:hypothetical protein
MCRHIINGVCGTCEIYVYTVPRSPPRPRRSSVPTRYPLTGAVNPAGPPAMPPAGAARAAERPGRGRSERRTLTAGRAATLHESPAAPATRHTWRDSRQKTAEQHRPSSGAGAGVGAPSRREDATHATPRAQGARSRSRAAGVRARRTPGTTPRPTRSRLQTLVGTRQASACCP